jgi:hypothetical protein
MKLKDTRIKLMNEILSGIKVTSENCHLIPKDMNLFKPIQSKNYSLLYT